jgi:geranylgeranyl diphosphate synthase type II
MAAEACGGSFAEALPGAVAVEMIHCYSLIHDDLPAMDDDDLRRGRPTVHVKYDQATAILAGDALLAEAFSHLARHVPDPARSAEAVRVLAEAAGPTKLVGGQADDLEAEQPPSAPGPNQSPRHNQPAASQLEHLESIHRRKTGALFAASIDLGAVLSGAESRIREILGNYARDLGLAFQVVDDLLDSTADARSMGKRTGKDATRGKLTYPGLLGVGQARAKAEQLVESAAAQVAVFGPAASRLTWLANYVLERSH